MDSSDAGFDFDRYRRLLAEATDERKRLALIDLLIEEKAVAQALRARLSGLGLKAEAPAFPKPLSMEKVLHRKSP